MLEAANTPRRMIRVMAPDEYGVYRDQERNTRANVGRIINVSKADIAEIFERC